MLSISVTKRAKSIAESRIKTLNSSNFEEGITLRSKRTKSPLEIPDPITRTSTKPYLPVQAYAASTHHGLYRIVNEDKTSIVLSSSCLFAIFDGYNGIMAADYLKEKLLMQILYFGEKKAMASILQDVFTNTDTNLLASQQNTKDKSGSSALVCVLKDNNVYVANVGTSVAIGKKLNGEIIRLAHPHDCKNVAEYARTKISLKNSAYNFVEGPLRIHPHGLTVTRTMGNLEAKSANSNTQKLVISTP
jgi:serine/threonine protein phosphatase PrpC